METRSQIVKKFINVAEHIDQCFDFEISLWLEKYEMCKNEKINFCEAAFLIISAAQIYGRKVDHLEKIIIEFNRRGAAAVAAAAADAKKPNGNEKGKVEKQQQNKEKKQQEKVLRKKKSVLKTTGTVEITEKEITAMVQCGTSIELHEEKAPDDEEDEFEHIRMKNVFPRVNIIQSNLQNNWSFYDVLKLPEQHLEHLDLLRDFRIFMDTVEEPIKLEKPDMKVFFAEPAEEYVRVIQRGKQKAFHVFLPASYIKEKYDVDIPDDSEYYNMLKYNAEFERLNLRKLSIAQLCGLKVGAYLNNILHGYEQDCKTPVLEIDIPEPKCEIPELDSGIGVNSSFCGSTNNQSIVNITLEANTTMAESTIVGDSTINDSTIVNNTTAEASSILNTSMEMSSPETSMLDTTANSDTKNYSEMEQSLLTNSQIGEQSTNDMNMLDPVVEVRDIFYPMNMHLPEGLTIDISGPIKGMLNLDVTRRAISLLHTNIFEIPEKLLRRPKIFKLSEDFDIWLAKRKRKAATRELDPRPTKMLKLYRGSMITLDGDSDCEELFGWDDHNNSMLVRSNIADIIEMVIPSLEAEAVEPGTVTPIEQDAQETITLTENHFGEEINGQTVTVQLSAEQNKDTSVAGVNIAAQTDFGFSELASFPEPQCEQSLASIDATMMPPPVLSSTVNEVENGSLTADDGIIYDEWERIEEEQDLQNEEMREIMDRVSKWHTLLHPVLQESEQRSHFDINAVGTDIIDMFPPEKPEHEITFSNVLENREPSYCARYFLSLLLLTNTKNVQLSVEQPQLNGKRVCPTDDIKLKLLSRTRHYDEVLRLDEHLEAAAAKRKSMDMDFYNEPSTSTSTSNAPQFKKQKKIK